MKKLKVNVKIIDKHKIFDAKGSYNPESRLLEVKTRRLSRDVLRFVVDPDHLYPQIGSRIKYVVFVDIARRISIPIPREKTVIEDGRKRKEQYTEIAEVGESIPIHSNDDKEELDLKTANKLDFHTERSFWKALMESHKIPISTLLITLFAGMGIYLIIVTFLRACGINV